MAKDEQLSEMEAAFISIPLRSGYAYEYWRKGVDCVLPKKKNSNKVDALRTLILLEASFNFSNKFNSPKVAHNAELLQGFTPEQYGSRKHHRAIDHALNKTLTIDLLRQNKRPGVLCPNDLKSCYDRICHNIAGLCMRWLGLSESETVCMFQTLQQMNHQIRCAYGDSTRSYGPNPSRLPMQGVYQGNSCSPVVWAAVSSPVLQIMKEEGFGTFFKEAISRDDIRLVGYAFVDDTDLIQTGVSAQEPIESVIKRAQAGMNLWEGLIRATGGALAADKCCWWAIDFEWQDDRTWKYKSIADVPGVLQACDFDGQIKELHRLEVDEAFETLGVWISPSGDISSQVSKMKDKAIRWAERLRASHLKDQESSAALSMTILKTLEYPLQVLHLDSSECSKIMSPILKAALPKAKFNRNFC